MKTDGMVMLERKFKKMTKEDIEKFKDGYYKSVLLNNLLIISDCYKNINMQESEFVFNAISNVYSNAVNLEKSESKGKSKDYFIIDFCISMKEVLDKEIEKYEEEIFNFNKLRITNLDLLNKDIRERDDEEEANRKIKESPEFEKIFEKYTDMIGTYLGYIFRRDAFWSSAVDYMNRLEI